MNRIVATLAVASVAFAKPETCAQVNLKTADGVDFREGSEAEYFLVALLKAW